MLHPVAPRSCSSFCRPPVRMLVCVTPLRPFRTRSGSEGNPGLGTRCDTHLSRLARKVCGPVLVVFAAS